MSVTTTTTTAEQPLYTRWNCFKSPIRDVKSGDFQIFGLWEKTFAGPLETESSYDPDEPAHRDQQSIGKPIYMQDDSKSDRYYKNVKRSDVSLNFFGLTLFTPLCHSVLSIGNVAFRILKLATFANFWMEKDEETDGYKFKARLSETGKDLFKVAITPLSIVGLQLIALAGIFRPFDARKLYATVERLTYGGGMMASHFQPVGIKQLTKEAVELREALIRDQVKINESLKRL